MTDSVIRPEPKSRIDFILNYYSDHKINLSIRTETET
jgi:hypothetical protein